MRVVSFGLFVVVGVLFILSAPVVGATTSQWTISDNFDDGSLSDGSPLSWNGDVDSEPGWEADGTGTMHSYDSGQAASDDMGGYSMSVDFPEDTTYAEVTFQITQKTILEDGSMEMGFGSGSTDMLMAASPVETLFENVTGFASYDNTGNITAPTGDVVEGQALPDSDYWVSLKYVFDLSADYVMKVYVDDTYAAYSENYENFTNVDSFTIENTNASVPVTWVVDNFSATSVPEPASLMLLGLGGLFIRCRR